jgi:hypothetical protein
MTLTLIGQDAGQTEAPTSNPSDCTPHGVGRRAAELCGLAFECLDYDFHIGTDGVLHRSPVLVHDMPKVNKYACRLPIHDREVEIITAQKARVRPAFPDTPTARLVLFPARRNNPDGTRAIAASRLQRAVDKWVTALPRLDSVDPDGISRSLPFPRDRVHPYRHHASTRSPSGP